MPSDQDADSPSYSHDDSNQPPASPRTAALMRKRKNADAQAAFRARRANYIANLEETGMCLSRSVRCLLNTPVEGAAPSVLYPTYVLTQ